MFWVRAQFKRLISSSELQSIREQRFLVTNTCIDTRIHVSNIKPASGDPIRA